MNAMQANSFAPDPNTSTGMSWDSFLRTVIGGMADAVVPAHRTPDAPLGVAVGAPIAPVSPLPILMVIVLVVVLVAE